MSDTLNREICAAVITYHPGADVEEALVALRPQVGGLVVVDNCSSRDEVEHLRRLAARLDYCLIENPENLGIATALNQSIKWANVQARYEAILFFDQDSFVAEDFVSSMLAEYRKYRTDDRVFLVTPRIVHRRLDKTFAPLDFGGKYLVAQTSGSLMPLSVFNECGVYRDDLFIDFVDYEFCLRSARHGWRLVYCPQAVLYHEPGNETPRRFFKFFQVTPNNASPLRRYYIMRNGLWLVGRYALRQPRWAAYTLRRLAIETVKAIMFEDRRSSKIRMWARAIRDLLRGRRGKLPAQCA